MKYVLHLSPVGSTHNVLEKSLQDLGFSLVSVLLSSENFERLPIMLDKLGTKYQVILAAIITSQYSPQEQEELKRNLQRKGLACLQLVVLKTGETVRNQKPTERGSFLTVSSLASPELIRFALHRLCHPDIPFRGQGASLLEKTLFHTRATKNMSETAAERQPIHTALLPRSWPLDSTPRANIPQRTPQEKRVRTLRTVSLGTHSVSLDPEAALIFERLLVTPGTPVAKATLAQHGVGGRQLTLTQVRLAVDRIRRLLREQGIRTVSIEFSKEHGYWVKLPAQPT